MRILQTTPKNRMQGFASGFTLAETMVAVLIAAVMILALYGSFTFGYAMIRVTREDTRATQIIIQQMEAVRLSPYDVVANPATFPTNVTAYFDEKNQASGNGGTAYTVSIRATPGPTVLPPTYRADVMLVTVSASWASGNLQCSRSMQTYVARNGIQNYVAGY